MREADKLSLTENLIFEGMTSIRAVIAAIESGESDRKILRIMVAKSRVKARKKELSYLKAMSYKYGFPLDCDMSDEEIDTLSIGGSHGGILMETTARTIPSLSKEAIEKIPEGERFFVMLEGIEDPYNFGYAIRSLYAAGVNALILPPRSFISVAGIVCRASAGASETIPTYIVESSSDCAALMKESGVKIVCCDMKNSVSIYDADLKKPLLLVVGGEKRGLTSDILSEADTVIRLDYGRDFPSALSAASAAAVASFEVLRQNL